MPVDQDDLNKKRYEAFLSITRASGGVALSGAVGAPTLELAKQLGISIADAWLCLDIYRKYFDKDLKAQDLPSMLRTSGVIVLGGGIAGYAGIRLAQAALSEILDSIPIAKSIITALAFGSSTLIIGFAWLSLVESAYFAGQAED